jgi:hypothetical protein
MEKSTRYFRIDASTMMSSCAMVPLFAAELRVHGEHAAKANLRKYRTSSGWMSTTEKACGVQVAVQWAGEDVALAGAPADCA